MKADWLLRWHTIRHLRPKQAWFYLIRRGLPPRRVREPGHTLQTRPLSLRSPIAVRGIHRGEGLFRFLNHTEQLNDNSFNWWPEQVTRLWRYNLHYFDYLRETERPLANKTELLTQWVRSNPQNTQPGWEPFTISLRIVNWVFFLQRYPELASEEIKLSLYTQAAWLEKNDERHILANHYFENLKALAFAGAYFDGKQADRWLRRAKRELIEQLQEQTLADGGHYERNPQYHGLMLENTLDLYNLASSNTEIFEPHFAETLQLHNEKALSYYEDIQFPDGQPPLFRDTAFGIAPSASSLRAYCNALNNRSLQPNSVTGELIRKRESGVFGYRHQQDMLAINAAAVGPSYQPGHTHCDLLSYELMLAGQRIVVDSGVSEYEPGEMREYARSTPAHNTISVDDEEQSEVWGEFRVGRRAEVLSADIKQQGQQVVFTGEYQGFPAVNGQMVHRRTIDTLIEKNDTIQSIRVVDRISGGGAHKLTSFIHLHPEISVLELTNNRIILKAKNNLTLKLEFDSNLDCKIDSSYYCSEFGLKENNRCIQLSRTSELPADLEYSIDIAG